VLSVLSVDLKKGQTCETVRRVSVGIADKGFFSELLQQGAAAGIDWRFAQAALDLAVKLGMIVGSRQATPMAKLSSTTPVRAYCQPLTRTPVGRGR
jgi:hypothetical protein